MWTQAETGMAGEYAVVEYLRARGAIIVERNWRSGRYETDIIAKHKGCLCFVEVKTRSVTGLTPPEAALTPTKCRSLQRSAAIYMAIHHIDYECRIDLAAVDVWPDGRLDVRYIEDAVESHW